MKFVGRWGYRKPLSITERKNTKGLAFASYVVLKQLEEENRQLKKQLVADLSINKADAARRAHKKVLK